MRYWKPAPPKSPVAGLMTWPVNSSPYPNGHAFAMPMAGTRDGPVARPVTSLIRTVGMLPIDSSTGPPPVTGSPGGMITVASSCPPQTGTANGSVVDGGVPHERTARIVMRSGPSVHGWHFVSACGNDRYAEYCSPSAGMEEMSCTFTDDVPRYWKPRPQSAQNATYSWLPLVQSPPE